MELFLWICSSEDVKSNAEMEIDTQVSEVSAFACLLMFGVEIQATKSKGSQTNSERERERGVLGFCVSKKVAVFRPFPRCRLFGFVFLNSFLLTSFLERGFTPGA